MPLEKGHEHILAKIYSSCKEHTLVIGEMFDTKTGEFRIGLGFMENFKGCTGFCLLGFVGSQADMDCHILKDKVPTFITHPDCPFEAPEAI